MVITHRMISVKTGSDHVKRSYKPKCCVWFKNTLYFEIFFSNKLVEYIRF